MSGERRAAPQPQPQAGPGGPPPDAAARGRAADSDEAPPVVGTWPRAYAVVIGVLVTVIALLAWLTRSFS